MRGKLICAFFAALMAATLVARAGENCIRPSHHYEGHPKPNVYVVVVTSACDERRIINVQIFDAVTNEAIRSEEFPLNPGETRSVRVEYKGEKLFSYSVFDRLPE